MNPTEATPTGATVWDFLIACPWPIWAILVLVTFAFCVINADKLLALSGAIAGVFRNISKSANKKYISASIRSSVIYAPIRLRRLESKKLCILSRIQ